MDEFRFQPTFQAPADGMMVIAVMPDGRVHELPQQWRSPPVAPLQGIHDAAVSSFGADVSIVVVSKQEFPRHHLVHYRDGVFTFTPVAPPPRKLAPLDVDDVLELIGHFSGEQASGAESAPYIDLSERPAGEVVGGLEIEPARKMIPDEIGELMEAGETIAEARERLWSKLNDELAELQNQEALFGKSIPRRAEVENLLGILARLGEY